jgi:ferredoxin
MAALLAAAAEPTPAAPSFRLESDGVILICGRDETAIEAGDLLKEHLDVTVLIEPPATIAPLRTAVFPVAKGRVRNAKGHLGAFEVAVDDFAQSMPSSRGVLAFGPSRSDAKSNCDIILDLTGGTAFFPAADLRDGYLRADPNDPAAMLRAVLRARDLIGSFEKPRYVAYDASLCAHSRSQIVGCTRCLDLCPTAAITPAGDFVAIDASIAQLRRHQRRRASAEFVDRLRRRGHVGLRRDPVFVHRRRWVHLVPEVQQPVGPVAVVDRRLLLILREHRGGVQGILEPLLHQVAQQLVPTLRKIVRASGLPPSKGQDVGIRAAPPRPAGSCGLRTAYRSRAGSPSLDLSCRHLRVSHEADGALSVPVALADEAVARPRSPGRQDLHRRCLQSDRTTATSPPWRACLSRCCYSLLTQTVVPRLRMLREWTRCGFIPP